MRIWHLTRQRERRFDTITEIDTDDLCRSPFGGELCMPAFAAAAFENDFAFEKFLFSWLDRLNLSNTNRWQQNLDAVGWNLTIDQVKKLDKVSEILPAYPYWLTQSEFYKMSYF